MPNGTDTFLTIEAPAEGVFKDKGSRFLAFAFPVSSEEDVRQTVISLRQKYFDARHHCYAFRIGTSQEQVRAFDDGEPAHSAGAPILGQIRALNLTNVLVVVVRYFGGILLGVGGLIRAYKSAAAQALSAARIVSRQITRTFVLYSDYATMDQLMKLARDFGAGISGQKFEQTCEVQLHIRESLAESFLRQLQRIESVHIQPDPTNPHPTS